MKLKCKNWIPLQPNTNLEGLVGCCFRAKEMEFVGQQHSSPYNYFVLIKILDQHLIETTDYCEPVEGSLPQKLDRNIQWEYCCDFKIREARDQE